MSQFFQLLGSITRIMDSLPLWCIWLEFGDTSEANRYNARSKHTLHDRLEGQTCHTQAQPAGLIR